MNPSLPKLFAILPLGVYTSMNSKAALVVGLVVALSAASSSALNEALAVNTKFGRVEGLWLETAMGREIAGFVGLPYAKAPIGDLRFEVNITLCHCMPHIAV